MRSAEQKKEYYRKHYIRTKEKRASQKLQAKYGLTLEKYNELLSSQGGRCAICRELPKGKKRLAVDHNHETGKVRALLCSLCNRFILFAVENYPLLVQQAHEYLRQNQH